MIYTRTLGHTTIWICKIHFFIVSIIFLLIIQLQQSSGRFCDTEVLYTIGLKTFCESKDGSSISCIDNPVKAHIQCAPYYTNGRSNQLQTINCMNNGNWSELPMECTPECINDTRPESCNEIQYPTSYVQIAERSYEGVEKSEKFLGVILYERNILTNCELLQDKSLSEFTIQVPRGMGRAEEAWEEHKIFYYQIDRIKYDNQELCVLRLSHNDYIKFDENIKPSCKRSEVNIDKTQHTFDRMLPQWKKKCHPPQVIKRKVEALCFNYVRERFYEVSAVNGGLLGGSTTVSKQVDCSEGADVAVLQCNLGYQNIKSETNSYLNKCSYGEWEFESENSDDCKRVCGGINKKYEPTSIPLLFKGAPVDIISGPWHVGIYSNQTDNSEFQQICGGSLIHSNLVVSAGHCFDDLANGGLHPASNYLVGAGKKYRKFDIVERFQHYVGIKEIHIPENYQSNPERNDIAALILDHHVPYTKHIKPICIEWKKYGKYHVQDRVKGRLFGWGSTSLDDKSSGELLTIEVLTITNANCKKLVHPNYRADITGDRFCATNDRNATACRGDSGGGFVIKKGFRRNGLYYLLGVVSTGIDYTKYCSDGFITTFTNIQFYQDFLKSIIEKSRIGGLLSY